MTAIIFRELKDNRKGFLIWVVAMLGLVAIAAGEYPVVVESGDSIMALLETIPRIMLIAYGMVGMETIPINSPLGYYLGMYMWCSLVAFTHAAVLGTTIIAKEERNRTAEFIFTKPYPRKTIIKGKIIAAVLNVAAMTLTAIIANIGMLATQAKGESILGAIGITMLAMFLIQVLFLSVGMLLAARCKSNKRALSISVLFVLTSYVLMVIIEYVGTVDFLGFLTPFLYFPGAALVEKGFNIFYILLTIIIAAVSCHFTLSMYQRRDLHN